MLERRCLLIRQCIFANKCTYSHALGFSSSTSPRYVLIYTSADSIMILLR